MTKRLLIALSSIGILITFFIWLDRKQSPQTWRGVASPDQEEAVKKEQKKKSEARRPSESSACFTQTFTHERLKSHEDGERCLLHENVITLTQADYNPKSLCVRVNGKPVQVRKGHKQGEIRIAAVAGPKAVITASFCTGTLKCPDPCKIEQDDFMSAIGAMGGTEAVAAGWGDAADVSVEVENQLSRELAQAGESEFRGWNLQSRTEGCIAGK